MLEGLPVTEVIPPNDEDDREEVPDALKLNTMDPNTAMIARLLRNDAQSGEPPCDGMDAIYDGRRRYNMHFTPLGPDAVQPHNRSAYSGPAFKCQMTLEPLAGYTRKYLAEWSEKDEQPTIIWLVQPPGFTAWVPLSTQQALDVIKRSTGQNFPISLPPRAKRLEGYFNQQQNINMMTLGRQIKLEKAGDTFHISTDPSEACGGYASGYIYAMRFKTLYLIDKQGQATVGSMSSVKGINSLLVLDSTSPASASTIAVAIPGTGGAEVAFLTSIPMAHIYKYKEPKGSV